MHFRDGERRKRWPGPLCASVPGPGQGATRAACSPLWGAHRQSGTNRMPTARFLWTTRMFRYLPGQSHLLYQQSVVTYRQTENDKVETYHEDHKERKDSIIIKEKPPTFQLMRSGTLLAWKHDSTCPHHHKSLAGTAISSKQQPMKWKGKDNI